MWVWVELGRGRGRAGGRSGEVSASGVCLLLRAS